MLITRVQQLSLQDKHLLSADMMALMEEETLRARYQRKNDKEREKKERLKAIRGSEKSPIRQRDDQSGRGNYAGNTDKDNFRSAGSRTAIDADGGSIAKIERRREDNWASTATSTSTTARSSAITANSSSGSINDLDKQVARSTTVTAAAALVEVPVPSSSSGPSNPHINPFKKVPAAISTKMTPLSRASPLPSPKESPSGSKDMAGTSDALYSAMSYGPSYSTLFSPRQFDRSLPFF